MLDPALAFQTAVRSALVASPDVLELVPALNIRAGATRPDKFPCLILSGAQTEYLGRAAGAQRLARVWLDLNIWATEDGADTARAIGAAAFEALEFAPVGEAIAVDDYAKPRVIRMRDPQPERAYTHGVMTLEAVVRWKV